MPDSPLALEALNAVVVGNGAIGSAFCEALLARPSTRAVALLGRSSIDAPDDDRLLQVSIDATDAASVQAAASQVGERVGEVHLLLNTVGVLHRESQQPEKRLREVEPENMLHAFQVNAVFLSVLAEAFSRLLRHGRPAILASLSARVGSIEDNALGGWYSYRASKAAHNMLLRTLAREWAVSHRHVTVVALHPGTVRSRLSAPFITDSYRNRVLQPAESATALLEVLSGLTPEDSGAFFDWRGEPIPW